METTKVSWHRARATTGVVLRGVVAGALVVPYSIFAISVRTAYGVVDGLRRVPGICRDLAAWVRNPVGPDASALARNAQPATVEAPVDLPPVAPYGCRHTQPWPAAVCRYRQKREDGRCAGCDEVGKAEPYPDPLRGHSASPRGLGEAFPVGRDRPGSYRVIQIGIDTPACFTRFAQADEHCDEERDPGCSGCALEDRRSTGDERSRAWGDVK